MATLQKKVSRGHTYWQIVESRRVNGKPRPIVLLHLGSAENLLRRLQEEPGRPVKARVFQFGPLAALWRMAHELDLVEIIDRHVPKREQGLSCGQYLLLAALNRCVGGTSKASFYDWYRRTILQRLLPASKAQLSSQRFWDHMGYLDGETIARIEQDLAHHLITHFKIDLRTLLLDATNFDTFIDTRTESDFAKRGHAKSKRSDLRILGLALLVSTDFHVPLLSHLYPGNENDVTVFANLTDTLVRRYRQFAAECDLITLVFDGGNTSRENLQAVDRSGYHFITSLTLTHHQELLQVPLTRFRACSDPRLSTTRAYRTTKELWGETRTLVVTRNRKLLDGQIAAIRTALGKKRAELQELHRRLVRSQEPGAKGKGYTRESLEKRLTAIVSGQYVSQILKTQIVQTGNHLDFTFGVDTQAFEQLKRIRLGKRILCTDNHTWTTDEIILGSRAQSRIEQAFKQMKDPHWVTFSPAFHWTDQKLRVHAFYCVLALMLSSLLQRRAAHNGVHLTIPALYDQLAQVTEIVNLLPSAAPSGRGGRPRAQYVLAERTPLQDQLCRILDVYPVAHP
jgi:transposase